MPVIGHAFVGLGTAMCTQRLTRPSVGAAMWAPIGMGMAYLPDVIGQAVKLIGGNDVSIVTHSVIFALVVSVAIGAGLARMGTTSFRVGTVVGLASVLLHIGLDLMQSTNREPWWPVSDRQYGFSETPINPLQEAAIFGSAFALFVGGRWLGHRRRSSKAHETVAGIAAPLSLRWANGLLMGSILLAACGTHYLRGLREQAYQEVRREIREGHYEAALAAADRAERWPPTAKPGHLDCARGEIHAALGDRERANAAFVRGLKADPHYFWGLVDAAAFYARSTEPANVRRAKVQPLLDQLKIEFADHEALPRHLERIERHLNAE